MSTSEHKDGKVSNAPAWSPTLIQRRLALATKQYTNAELARLTGFHPEAIRRYRQGRTPPASFVAAVCHVLQISPSWMLLGRQESASNRQDFLVPDGQMPDRD